MGSFMDSLKVVKLDSIVGYTMGSNARCSECGASQEVEDVADAVHWVESKHHTTAHQEWVRKQRAEQEAYRRGQQAVNAAFGGGFPSEENAFR